MEIAPAGHDSGLRNSVAETSTVDAINSSSSALSDSVANNYDDEDEDVCRICRNPGDTDNPLRYPCACSGSIKYVHQDCLLQWLNHSNARQCEVRC
ncbi:putative e3 ubiquitin ligase sud1 [Nicotiana attenuata]|uniref:RING-type E3 ubiquitin transferase n=1 Tax=Nicotiana attenuata TaxID=49451 RepID=A0A1J6IHX7_NICAT|nr:putative e3 ubiquitin ligase sud1 [Nicotiana attenuata]